MIQDKAYQNYTMAIATTAPTSNPSAERKESTNMILDDSPDLFLVPVRSPTSTMDLPIATPTDHHRDMKYLQQRDEQFVANLPPDIVAEQERIWNDVKSCTPRKDSAMPSVSPSPPSSSSSSPSPPTESQAAIPSNHDTRNDTTNTRDKRKNKANMAVGAIVGGVAFGPAWPVGMVVGGATGAYAGKYIAKVKERRSQRKHEQESFQKAASSSVVAKDADIAVYA